jgi:3-dehydroquinate synthase
MAATLSQRLGWIDDAALTRSLAVIESAELPLAAPANMSSDDFLTRMRLDKKNIDARLRLVLLNALGDACISDATLPEMLRLVIDTYPRR